MKISVEINEGCNYGVMPASERYVAIDLDTYDCDCDQDGFFSLSPVGHGATEQQAIQDLLDQMEDV